MRFNKEKYSGVLSACHLEKVAVFYYQRPYWLVIKWSRYYNRAPDPIKKIACSTNSLFWEGQSFDIVLVTHHTKRTEIENFPTKNQWPVDFITSLSWGLFLADNIGDVRIRSTRYWSNEYDKIDEEAKRCWKYSCTIVAYREIIGESPDVIISARELKELN